ncbi:hypothetical protein P4S63_22610 [Pseudoalteromonas sp. B193]
MLVFMNKNTKELTKNIEYMQEVIPKIPKHLTYSPTNTGVG